MVARISTISFNGIETVDVEVQVQISPGLPGIMVVGLGDKIIAESRERIRAAFSSMGLQLPIKRVTVNLAPADLSKEGTHFDLPIALGILQAIKVLTPEQIGNHIVMGELGLDGSVSSVPGILPAAVTAHKRGHGLICPKSDGGEATLAGRDLPIVAVASLQELINHLRGQALLESPEPLQLKPTKHICPDLAEVKGQETAKRALEIAAAGGHSMLMTGPPGSGKSLLASILPALLPPLLPEEALEVSMIRSLAGVLNEQPFSSRPYRAPHHSASQAALVGGGQKARPGEITLAHRGVLFLDELPEFPRAVLESLRQPIESGKTLVARANHHLTYPARFQLVAAMNPCRCGMLGDPLAQCTRAPRCGSEYQTRISGPFYDRIDLAVFVPALAVDDFSLPKQAETTAQVAARVATARQIQRQRYASTKFSLNSDCDGKLLEEVASPDEKGKSLLMATTKKLRLSGRGYGRILRVARTVADMEGNPQVNASHIAEAANFRRIHPIAA